MRTDNPKLMIPLIRKAIPSVIAKEIVDVQPMTGSTGDIFSMTDPWSEWRKTISIWPRKSISGKIIFGYINKRARTIWGAHGKLRIREFSTNKELFASRLKGDA